MPQMGMINPNGANRTGMAFTMMVTKGGLFDFEGERPVKYK